MESIEQARRLASRLFLESFQPDRRPYGHVIDVVIDRRGSLDVVLNDHNIIVASFGKLVAALLKREPGYEGAQYLAVGSGLDSWDTDPPSEMSSTTTLVNEIYRKQITPDNVNFIDESGNITTDVTNVVQFQVVFSYTEGNGIWRELGLFGGKATAEINSGFLINHKIHEKFVKTQDQSVVRTVRLAF